MGYHSTWAAGVRCDLIARLGGMEKSSWITCFITCFFVARVFSVRRATWLLLQAPIIFYPQYAPGA